MAKITGKQTPLSEIAQPLLEQLEKRMEVMGMKPILKLESYSTFITVCVGVQIGNEQFGTWQTIGNNPSTPDLMPGIIELKIRRMVEYLFFESTTP